MKRLMLLLGVFLMGAPVLWAQSEAPTKKVAILEVVDRDNAINYGVKLLLRTTLAKAITQTQGYEGYDRVDMVAIQGEQDFQRTGMVSDEQIKRLGEMTGAAYVLVAEAAKIDASNMIVTAKILDVETAKLERTDYEQMGMSAQEMAEGCRTMAGRLFSSPEPVIGRGGKTEVAYGDEDEITLDSESTVVRKGANLFVQDKYMVQNKMTKEQARNYLGNYFNSWQDAKKQRVVGISLFATGSVFAVVGISVALDGMPQKGDGWVYDGDKDEVAAGFCVVAVGIGLVIAAIPTYVIAGKKMDRILQAANEQHGILPYRTAVSLNIGNQPHGVGLGIRF
ncbi:MAG: hypothetical protein K2I87_04225 [Bacteroidales bacterium]|nr:hypothetical protein [Bacteroidales bacterium]